MENQHLIKHMVIVFWIIIVCVVTVLPLSKDTHTHFLKKN